MTIQYQNLLKQILDEGVRKGDRTGTGTTSLFGAQLRFDLSEGFPLLTTKKLPFRWIAEELFWFLSGSTYEPDLREKGVDIWKEWATKEQCARFDRKEGDLGPVYGHQWRNYGATWLYRHDRSGLVSFPVGPSGYKGDGIDQIASALDLLQNNPDSRRIIVSGWNPKEATQVALPPCHTVYQFGTYEEQSAPVTAPNGDKFRLQDRNPRRILSCHMYQRSADVFLGVPFNIASYALLTHLFASVLGYKVGTLTISFGDVHIYNTHREQVQEQLGREPRPLPKLTVRRTRFEEGPMEELLRLTYEDLTLMDYKPHPKIRAEVSV